MRNGEIVKRLLKEHTLCNTCLGRQFPSELKGLDNTSKGIELKRGVRYRLGEACYICGGMMSSIERYADMVIKALNEYEFDSLVIGARIPTTIVEREDHLRAEMKLKGGETFKTSFTRELNSTVSKRLDVEVRHRRPDVTVIVDSLLDMVDVTSRSIYVYGRYIKTKRGIPQKRRRCRECRGKGCPECNLTGYTTTDSVEQRLTEPILTLFRAGRVKFTWIGSEDSDSLVLGGGRPFYAEVLEPRARRPRRIKAVMKKVGDGVSVKEMKILDGRPREERRFTVTVQSSLTLDRRITKKDIKKLEETFEGASVRMTPSNKKSSTTKKIYSLTVESAKGRNLQVKVECDGGLSLRRFFTGEGGEVIPNVASTLERSVALDEEKPFDILDVNFEA
ncbi:MAG: tRNA pseudouridine(54/55) synthase Pus10 [Nitrososphaerales archaeon]